MKNNKIHLGHMAKKRFGQNFLIDQNVISNIVKAINPKAGQNLIEIGPGLAALTEPVCELTDKLMAIEIDKDIIERLKGNPFYGAKLEIIEKDALTVDFTKLASPTNKAKIFGNLPYNIGTPIIECLLKNIDIVEEMTFMLQKEVVERICACKGSRHYGRLSLFVQYFCRVLPVCDVPPESFRPAPKVDSAVVKLVPRKVIKNPVKNFKEFETITALAFNQRRKTIRNSLERLFSADDWKELEASAIDCSRRAEELTMKDFITLTNYASDKRLFEKLKS